MPEPVKSATASLAEALILFQTDLPKLGKDKTAKVPTKAGGSYSYSYADLNSITNAVMPLLTKCGLSFSAKPRRNDDGSYDLVGVLRHTSGQTDEGVLPLFTRGTAQETGSSMTYARRYLLTALTGVVPDEDDDGQAAAQGQRAAQERPQNTPQQDPLDAARQQAFNRHRAVFPTTATRETFMAAAEAEFAQPFGDITVEQLQSFGQASA